MHNCLTVGFLWVEYFFHKEILQRLVTTWSLIWIDFMRVVHTKYEKLSIISFFSLVFNLLVCHNLWLIFRLSLIRKWLDRDSRLDRDSIGSVDSTVRFSGSPTSSWSCKTSCSPELITGSTLRFKRVVATAYSSVDLPVWRSSVRRAFATDRLRQSFLHLALSASRSQYAFRLQLLVFTWRH